jgi:hypothetical protein
VRGERREERGERRERERAEHGDETTALRGCLRETGRNNTAFQRWALDGRSMTLDIRLTFDIRPTLFV